VGNDVELIIWNIGGADEEEEGEEEDESTDEFASEDILSEENLTNDNNMFTCPWGQDDPCLKEVKSVKSYSTIISHSYLLAVNKLITWSDSTAGFFV
jgi:hypothetical protein